MEKLVLEAQEFISTLLSHRSIEYVDKKNKNYISYDVQAVLLFLWIRIEIAENNRDLSK